MTDETTKLADLPAQWEAEAGEIDARIEAGEISGEVWETRRDILIENAVDLRFALAKHTKAGAVSTEAIPSSAYRLTDWLGARAYPHDPEPETNDICDWALAKLVEQDRILQSVVTTSTTLVDKSA